MCSVGCDRVLLSLYLYGSTGMEYGFNGVSWPSFLSCSLEGPRWGFPKIGDPNRVH